MQRQSSKTGQGHFLGSPSGGPTHHHKIKRRVTFRASQWVAFGLTNTADGRAWVSVGTALSSSPLTTLSHEICFLTPVLYLDPQRTFALSLCHPQTTNNT